MLNKADVKKFVTSKLGDFLTPEGYKSKKAAADVLAAFEKQDAANSYGFHSFLNTYNGYELVYSFEFGVNRVVDILREIDAKVPLAKNKYTVKDNFTAISPGVLRDPLNPTAGYPLITSEVELIREVDAIKDFFNEQFVPFYEKYSNISELDKLVNSPSDFWISGTGKKTPISFFHVTRLIFAKLGGNPDFEWVVEKNYQALEELWKKEGGVYDRTDQTKPEVVAADYLRKL